MYIVLFNTRVFVDFLFHCFFLYVDDVNVICFFIIVLCTDCLIVFCQLSLLIMCSILHGFMLTFLFYLLYWLADDKQLSYRQDKRDRAI